MATACPTCEALRRRIAELEAANEKNREGNSVAIRADLAEDLRGWLGDKLRRLQEKTRAIGRPIPMRLPADTLVFTVPAMSYSFYWAGRQSAADLLKLTCRCVPV